MDANMHRNFCDRRLIHYTHADTVPSPNPFWDAHEPSQLYHKSTSNAIQKQRLWTLMAYISSKEWYKRDSFHLVHKIGLQINLHISIPHKNKKQNIVVRVTDDVSANGSERIGHLVEYVNFHNWLTNYISPGCKTACLLIDITLSRNMKVVNKQLHNYQSKDNTLIDWSISSEFV